MAYVALHQLLASTTVTRVISRIPTPQNRFQKVLGLLPEGPNVNPVGGRQAGWDTFDKTRSIATGRPPGVGPTAIAPNPIGHVTATIPRAHEKIPLLDDMLHRTRAPGSPWGTVDLRGQRYVTAQEGYLAQRFVNWREFMVSRMLRGGFQLKINGDSHTPVDTGGHITVDYQIPAGNKSKLDMLGAGDIIGTSWANAASDIVTDLLQINSANEQLHGRPLRHMWCNSVVFGYLTANTGIRALGGTANTAWEIYRPDGESNADGIPSTGFEVVLKAVPWLTIHVYDGGLDVDGTFTKFLDDTHAIFHPEVNSDWVEMYEGSEIVRESKTDPGSERFGRAAWTEISTQPSGFELIVVDNVLPVLYIPKCVQYATVVY